MDNKLVKKRLRNRNRIGQNKSFINLQDESGISPYGSQSMFRDQLPLPSNNNCLQINSIESHLNFKKKMKTGDNEMETTRQENLLTEKSEKSKTFNLPTDRESDMKTKSDFKYPNTSS